MLQLKSTIQEKTKQKNASLTILWRIVAFNDITQFDFRSCPNIAHENDKYVNYTCICNSVHAAQCYIVSCMVNKLVITSQNSMFENI